MSDVFMSGAALLDLDDLSTAKVVVPEWTQAARKAGKIGPEDEVAVYVRTMKAAERDAFETSMFEGRGSSRRQNLDNLRARLVAKTAVDKDGNPLWKAEQVKRLGEKNAAAIDRIFDAAQRLNGMSSSDVEEMVKN